MKQSQVSKKMLLLCACAALEAQGDYYMKSHLFGDIYASDQFSPAERELLTVAALSAMDGVEPQFEGHKECAVFMGNTKEQVEHLCQWLTDNIK